MRRRLFSVAARSETTGSPLRAVAAAGVVGGVVVVAVGTTYSFWRENEISSIRKDALTLLTNGFVVLNSSVSSAEKRMAWEGRKKGNVQGEKMNKEEEEVKGKGLKRIMTKHWESQHEGFSLLDSSTWPQPASGRVHKLTYNNDNVPDMPKLTTDNYRLQAVTAYIVDPDMRIAHFGDNTHPRLLLLMHPFIALLGGVKSFNCTCDWIRKKLPLSIQAYLPSFINRFSGNNDNDNNNSNENTYVGSGSNNKFIELQGSDQSWHIISLPNLQYGQVGKALPLGTHIDNGEDAVYKDCGFPTLSPGPSIIDKNNNNINMKTDHENQNQIQTHTNDNNNNEETNSKIEPQSQSLSREDELVLTMLHQLAILFHCETPGDLLIENGATGLFPKSHLALLRALSSLPPPDNQEGGKTIATSSTSTSTSSNDPVTSGGSSKSGVMSFAVHTVALKELGDELEKENRMLQVPIPEDKQVLLHGLLAHTACWSSKLMHQEKEVRVIQNCKLKFAEAIRRDHSMQLKVLRDLPHNSLLRVMARADLNEWKEKLGFTDVELRDIERIKSRYNELVQKELALSTGNKV